MTDGEPRHICYKSFDIPFLLYFAGGFHDAKSGALVIENASESFNALKFFLTFLYTGIYIPPVQQLLGVVAINPVDCLNNFSANIRRFNK